jgi:hypothetical protein
MLLCHYETPLRRRGNLMYTITYEIASVVTLPRKDITTQSRMPWYQMIIAGDGTVKK